MLEATASGMVAVQTTDYYPYGLPHALNNTHLNRYLFSGKELQDQTLGGSPLGLYDFHARFYNPVLGRWFNPDPARQFANPYVYGGNSPLMYRDKDGRWIWIAIGIGAVANVLTNVKEIDSLVEGINYAFWGGIMAMAGTVAGPMGVGALYGGGNDLIDQVNDNGWKEVNWDQVLGKTITGAVTGAMFGVTSKAVRPLTEKLTRWIGNPLVQQVASDGLTAGISGSVVNTTMTAASGADSDQILDSAWRGFYQGFGMGATYGAAQWGQYASRNNLNFWTGRSYLPQTPVDFSPKGDNITLYRAMSGNENPNRPLFMTDDPAYARQYGSDVRSVTIDRLEFQRLRSNYQIIPGRGAYFQSPMIGTEYQINNPQLNTYILNNIQK